MRRYLDRFGIFKTTQVNPYDPSTVDLTNQPPSALNLYPRQRNRAVLGSQQRVRHREESAIDFPKPKRTRFEVSNLPSSTLTNSCTRPMTVKLKSSDGKIFKVTGEALFESSKKVRTEIESAGWCVGDVIGVPDVDGRALAVAIQYAEKRFSGARRGRLERLGKGFL